jgi:hypothetical protein
METKIYKPHPNGLLLRKVFGIIVAIMGVGPGCTIASFGLLFLPDLFSAEKASPQSWSLALCLPGFGLLMGGLFVVVGLMVALSGQKDQVELTPEVLNMTEVLTLTKKTLRLSEITALTCQWHVRRRRHRTWGYWVLLITDRLGQTIALDLHQEGYPGTFDVRSIIRDLKPRLPATVTIAPQVETYLATGQMKAEG